MKFRFHKSLQICGLSELLSASLSVVHRQSLRRRIGQTSTPTLKCTDNHSDTQCTDSHSDIQCTATPTPQHTTNPAPKCTDSHSDTAVHGQPLRHSVHSHSDTAAHNQSGAEVHRQPLRHSVHNQSGAEVHIQPLRHRSAQTAIPTPQRTDSHSDTAVHGQPLRTAVHRHPPNFPSAVRVPFPIF